MRALVFEGPDRVALRSVADPVLVAPTDALVEIMVAGICGTDTHAVHAPPDGLEHGTILGHEFVGRVVDVGAAVTTVRAGDVVVGADYTACGHCWWCRGRNHWHCPQRRFFGTGSAFGPPQPGALAERLAVPFADTALAPLPHVVTPQEAVFATDTLATAVSACERADVRPGAVVGVVGAGPVGLMTAMAAQAFGASAVVVSDPISARRQTVEEVGAVATSPAELGRCGAELTDGRGYDVVFEAAGSPAALDAATGAVRGRGTVVSVGIPATPEWTLAVQAAFRRELTLAFVVGDPIRERDRILTMLATRQIDVRGLVGSQALLSDAVEWFHSFARGEVMKVLVDTATPGG